MTVDEAVELAARAHEGQKDKAGLPYIQHPVRVMERLRRKRFASAQALGRRELIDGPQATKEFIAAILHDVVEDTPVTPDDLLALGCPIESVRAVVALTRVEGESYVDFIARAAADPIARRVKRADLEDNASEERLSQLGRRQAEKLRVKYASGLSELDEWERYWAVVETQHHQPGGYFAYFLESGMLGRQWRWRETGTDRAFGWPELIHPIQTGGFWKPSTHDSIEGEITLERAHQTALAIGVSITAPRVRDWTPQGAVVRFGGVANYATEKERKEAEGNGLWRAVLGAAAGVAAFALFSGLRGKKKN